MLQSNFDHHRKFYPNGFQDVDNEIDRQAREAFEATRQSRRIICRRTQTGGRSCILRVARMMQLRQRTYGRTVQFLQSENYLSEEDINIIR